MAQHTPGPWHVDAPQYWADIHAATGERVATADAEIGEDTTRANARLIAAAPDLLRLLDALIPLAESRAEDMAENAQDMEGDENWSDEDRAAERDAAVNAWKHVEEARALRARLHGTLAPDA